MTEPHTFTIHPAVCSVTLAADSYEPMAIVVAEVMGRDGAVTIRMRPEIAPMVGETLRVVVETGRDVEPATIP